MTEDQVYAEYRQEMDNDYWRCPGCGRPSDVGCREECPL